MMPASPFDVMTTPPRTAVIGRGWLAYRRAMEADWPPDRAVGRAVYDLYAALLVNAEADVAELTEELARVLPAAFEGER